MLGLNGLTWQNVHPRTFALFKHTVEFIKCLVTFLKYQSKQTINLNECKTLNNQVIIKLKPEKVTT